MTSVVTLHVTNCSGGADLASATVTDGISIVYTNAYGEVLVYFDDPVGYAVQVSKSGFQARTVALYASQSGTTQTFCLNAVAAPPPSGGGGGGGGISCFIVTAATGSAESEEVVALRALRDRVGRHSAVAAALIDAVYAEYWQFSPAVAERLGEDKLARQAALLVAVRPLVAWYRLAGQLAFGRDDAGEVARDVAALRNTCPRWMSPRSMAERLAALRRLEPLPDAAPQALRDMAPHLHRAASLPLVNWAVLRPLEECWAVAAERGDPVERVGKWLGDAPIERLGVLPAGPVQAHADALAALLAFSPADQQGLLQRLHQVAARPIPPAPRPAGSGCGCGR